MARGYPRSVATFLGGRPEVHRMVLYRFLFAPVLLAVAVLTGARDRPPPREPPAALDATGVPAPAPSPAGSSRNAPALR